MIVAIIASTVAIVAFGWAAVSLRRREGIPIATCRLGGPPVFARFRIGRWWIGRNGIELLRRDDGNAHVVEVPLEGGPQSTVRARVRRVRWAYSTSVADEQLYFYFRLKRDCLRSSGQVHIVVEYLNDFRADVQGIMLWYGRERAQGDRDPFAEAGVIRTRTVPSHGTDRGWGVREWILSDLSPRGSREDHDFRLGLSPPASANLVIRRVVAFRSS